MNIGDILRQRRKKLGLTMNALAQKIGVSVVSIGNWERGDRDVSVSNIKRMCDALGMELIVRQKPRDGFTAQDALGMLDVDLCETDHVKMDTTPIIDTEHNVIGQRITLAFNSMYRDNKIGG